MEIGSPRLNEYEFGVCEMFHFRLVSGRFGLELDYCEIFAGFHRFRVPDGITISFPSIIVHTGKIQRVFDDRNHLLMVEKVQTASEQLEFVSLLGYLTMKIWIRMIFTT